MKLIQCNHLDNEIGIIIYANTEYDFYIPNCEYWILYGIELAISRYYIHTERPKYDLGRLRPITYDPI